MEQRPEMGVTRLQKKSGTEDRYPYIEAADLKIINTRWEIETDKICKVLTENTEFLVVGIIGGPGRQKSSLLNMICGLGLDDNIISSAFSTGESNSNLKNGHCTSGIDIRVSKDRIIALDSQPVFSLSVLHELLTRPFPCMELARMMSVTTSRGSRPPRTSAEAIYKTMALQMACFLFTVCHIVIFTCDGMNDVDMLELLECADLFAPSIALTAGSLMIPQTGTDTKVPWHLGECVLLFQNLKDDEMNSKNIFELEKRLKLRFKNSKLLNKDTISCWSGMPLSCPADSETKNADECGISIFEFPKPNCSVSEDSLSSITTLYEAMLESFCKKVRQYPTRKFCTNFTELQWLDWCSKVWKFIMKSKDISEFFFRLQLTVFKNGGGW